MSELEKLKLLVGDPTESDSLLQLYLDFAADIICEIRDTDIVESKYTNLQVKMALELYNKHGVEGQNSHTEHGVTRTYGRAEISTGLMAQITPVVKTMYSAPREVFP